MSTLLIVKQIIAPISVSKRVTTSQQSTQCLEQTLNSQIILNLIKYVIGLKDAKTMYQ